MKRTAIVLLAVMLAGTMLMAQTPAATQQTAPAAGQQTGQQQPPAAQQPKKGGPPMAKTKEEFDAYQKVAQQMQGGQLDQAEAAADQFAVQFPQSDLRGLLYTNLMNMYQQANNADKTVETGRKVLSIDPDNPLALVMVATVLAERTRDTDLDKDERFAEATKDAKHALEAVNNIQLPPNTPPEQAQAAKNTLISMAYSALGTVESTQQNFTAAEADLRKSVDTPGVQPDPLTLLRLAVTLDHAKKYAEALQVANKCVEVSQGPVKDLAQQERDRLVKLTASGAPATGTTPAAGTPAATTPAPGTPPATPKPPQPNI